VDLGLGIIMGLVIHGLCIYWGCSAIASAIRGNHRRRKVPRRKMDDLASTLNPERPADRQ
jgi:hypothetical protein